MLYYEDLSDMSSNIHSLRHPNSGVPRPTTSLPEGALVGTGAFAMLTVTGLDGSTLQLEVDETMTVACPTAKNCPTWAEVS